MDEKSCDISLVSLVAGHFISLFLFSPNVQDKYLRFSHTAAFSCIPGDLWLFINIEE